MSEDKLRAFLLRVFAYLKAMLHGTIRNDDFNVGTVLQPFETMSQ